MVPVVALAGEHAATVVAGAALTEALFGWPRLGNLVLLALLVAIAIFAPWLA
jgi:peptide/nickel transport system permease protein